MLSKSVRQTFQEYGRGVIGGLIFSLPLLYTMEVWWRGFIAEPTALLALVIATYLILLGYNRYAGMRENASFFEVCWDSVEEIGLSFIISFLFLLLINKVNFSMSIDEIAGKVIMESMIVAVGISVGTAQLGQKSESGSGMEGEQHTQQPESPLKVITLAICGAVLFSSSVAPTEEILQISVEANSIHILLMVIVSIALCASILFFIDFVGAGTDNADIRNISFNTLLCYLAALFSSFFLLWFFGRVSGNSFSVVLAQTVVLGIPAVIGASAGKLLIQNK